MKVMDLFENSKTLIRKQGGIPDVRIRTDVPTREQSRGERVHFQVLWIGMKREDPVYPGEMWIPERDDMSLTFFWGFLVETVNDERVRDFRIFRRCVTKTAMFDERAELCKESVR